MSHSRTSRVGLGVWALVVALVALVVLTFLPTAYVIQRPGPVYDTLGTATGADGEQLPLIAIDGAETFETSGSLNLLTIEVVGNRERTPSWFELTMAWLDSSRAVVPLDSVFPVGVTSEQRNEQNAVLMVDSQQEATAAALQSLGMDTGARVEVVSATEDSPADGLLDEGDIVAGINGTPVTSASELRATIQEAEGSPVELTVIRDGAEQQVELTPELSTANGVESWLIGISLTTTYDFPIDVTIQLDNVGGPSAGMMFALGIIDELTPGELTGGNDFAGTGTIDAAGDVGAIGGIRQKLYGAVGAGADYFLAPASNCDEVVGHIPDGLQVFRTATLDESLTIIETIADGGDLDALPTCTSS